MIAVRWERFVLAFVALLGAMALVSFGRHVWHAGAAPTEPSGTSVSSEVLTIYAPQALVDFAKAHPGITTNDELVRLTREAKLNVWFAIVTRHHQANGAITDIPILYRTGDTGDFGIAHAVLLTLAGKGPSAGPEDYANAKIEVVDDAMIDEDPLEGLRKLLQR
jgi:hypothetical protein